MHGFCLRLRILTELGGKIGTMKIDEKLQGEFRIPDTDGIENLPPLIRATCLKVAECYDADLATVAAAAMATLASALGGSVYIPSESSFPTISPFNLMIVTSADYGPAWYQGLRFPLLCFVVESQQQLLPAGVGPRGNPRGRTGNSHNAGQPLNPPLVPLVSPSAVMARMTPGDLKDAFDNSPDKIVSLGQFGLDPVVDVLQLSAGDRKELLRHLACSWEGQPLLLGRKICRGHLSLVWATHEQMILPLIESGFFDGTPAPPILWMPGGNGKIRSENTSGPGKDWNSLIEAAVRWRPTKPQMMELEAGAKAAFFAFQKYVEHCDEFPCARYLTLLPGLALRLGLVLAALDNQSKGGRVSECQMTTAVLLTKWFAGRHIQALASSDIFSVPAVADTIAATDKTDPAAVMLRKIRQKAPVSRRQLWRSYNDPKVSWFNETLKYLLNMGKVFKDGEGRLRIEE